MNKRLMRKIAKKIKELRKEKGYTQDDLAVLADIARSTLGNIETARNDVTVSKIDKIAKAFGLELWEFFRF